MAIATIDKTAESWMRDLYLPAYHVSEAAKYVGVHPNTISAWHYRGDPVLPGRTKGRMLSYLELIEVAFVAFFRKLGISMELVREARNYQGSTVNEDWRDSEILPVDDLPSVDFVEFAKVSVVEGYEIEERDFSVSNIESEYPFASLRFKTEGLHILTEYHKSDPSAPKWARSMTSDILKRLNWVHITENQFADFDYSHGIVSRWHLAGRDSQVLIDPRITFGDPTVSGLSTWVILGRYNAGETIPEIMDDFEISETAVRDALAFEGIRVA